MALIASALQSGAPYFASVTWALSNGDQGIAAEYPEYSDRSVQVSGTFGSGGTVVIEGSNNGTDWAVLSDPKGYSLSVTSADIAGVVEMTRYIRPRVSAGDGSTNLEVSMFLRRTGR